MTAPRGAVALPPQVHCRCRAGCGNSVGFDEDAVGVVWAALASAAHTFGLSYEAVGGWGFWSVHSAASITTFCSLIGRVTSPLVSRPERLLAKDQVGGAVEDELVVLHDIASGAGQFDPEAGSPLLVFHLAGAMHAGDLGQYGERCRPDLWWCRDVQQ